MQYKGPYLPFLQLLNKLKDINSYLVFVLITLPTGGESEKLKKGGGHIVQGLVFLKGGTDTFPI